jgi:fibronectin type 3 domain-containing protein
LDSGWLNSFVELYSSTPVEQVPNRIIGYSNLRINDNIVKLGKICVIYQPNTCNTGKVKITDTEVQVLTGPGVNDPAKYDYKYVDDRSYWYEEPDASQLKAPELVVKPDITDNPDPIQAPSNLKAETDTNNVYLSWKAPANALASKLKGYYIYRVTSDGASSSVPINKEIISSTAYTDKSVGKDKTLYYCVTAVNTYEVESVPTDKVLVKTNPVTIPKDLKANVSNNAVVLKWNMPVTSNSDDVLGYYVYRAATSDMKNAQRLNNRFITGTTLTDSSFKKDQAYFYAVKAVNKYGALSAFSNKSSVNAELGRPVNLTAKSYDKKVILKWSAPEGSNPAKIKGYYIYRGTTSGNEALVPINKTLIIGNSYSNSSVTAGKTYYYVIKAVNINGAKSQASNEVKIKAVN